MYRCRNLSSKAMKIRNKIKRRLPPVREETRWSVLHSDKAIYSVVIVTAVLCYANSLNGEFVHDDIPAIVTNKDVSGATPLTDLLLNDFWGTPMADVSSHKSYRPLTTLSFRINYALSGLSPWWWHVWNVGLHTACCVLVTRTCLTVAHLQRPFAALAAILFAIHPIHTEAVAGVVGRADVIACIFFLASLLAYHRASKNKKYEWLSIVFGALSMLAKETGITILILNLAFDMYRCWAVIIASLRLHKMDKKTSCIAQRNLKIIVSLMLLVYVRLSLMQGSLPIFSSQDNPAAFHSSFIVRLMTFCYLAAFNWWLLLCPWSLSHDWQMSSIPLITSVWDHRNLLTFAALCMLMWICYKCILDINIQKHTPAVLGVLLLVLPFIPATNLLFTVGFVVAERVLYIPSAGSAILTAYCLQRLWPKKPRLKTLLVMLIAVIAAANVAKTYRRNNDWKDRATLLTADLAILPNNAKLQYNFANYLREKDQISGAIKHYREALNLWPTYVSAHNNLGTLLSASEGAEQHFLQAIEYNQYHANAHFNLGKLYKKSGNLVEAARLLETCATLNPYFVHAYVELLSLKPDREKRRLLRIITELDPNNYEYYLLYGNWLSSQGLPRAAARRYREALRLALTHSSPGNTVQGDVEALRMTALVYRKLGWRSRTLQLITRWHTWRRGYSRPAATHVYLREWRLRMEMRAKAEMYIKAGKIERTTSCFSHVELSAKDGNVTPNPSDKAAIIPNDDQNTTMCHQNTSATKRTMNISPTIKTTHNKSEIDNKNKRDKSKKKPNVDDSNKGDKITGPITDEIMFKTL